MSDLKCVVVTPEQTELDVTAEAVTVPMFDGELGILKGHSPLVGRLGFGVLRISTSGNVSEYFVDGGFVQVSDNVVSVLTDNVTQTDVITSSYAAETMKAARELPTDQPELATIREKAIARASAMARVAK